MNDDEMSEKATMQIWRQIAKVILSRFDSFLVLLSIDPYIWLEELYLNIYLFPIVHQLRYTHQLDTWPYPVILNQPSSVN